MGCGQYTALAMTVHKHLEPWEYRGQSSAEFSRLVEHKGCSRQQIDCLHRLPLAMPNVLQSRYIRDILCLVVPRALRVATSASRRSACRSTTARKLHVSDSGNPRRCRVGRDEKINKCVTKITRSHGKGQKSEFAKSGRCDQPLGS